MLKSIIVMLIMFGTFTVIDVYAADETVSCDEHRSAARSIMEAKYSGVQMASLMKITGNDRITKQLVTDAYNAPRHNTQALKIKDIDDFGDEEYLKCIKRKM